MPAAIKAIIFKTPDLNADRVFFEEVLQLKILECSAQHFVIHSKNIRLVFIATPGAFEMEIYVTNDSVNTQLKNYKSPDGIKVVVIKQ